MSAISTVDDVFSLDPNGARTLPAGKAGFCIWPSDMRLNIP